MSDWDSLCRDILQQLFSTPGPPRHLRIDAQRMIIEDKNFTIRLTSGLLSVIDYSDGAKVRRTERQYKETERSRIAWHICSLYKVGLRWESIIDANRKASEIQKDIEEHYRTSSEFLKHEAILNNDC